jgi:hypothetical protein
MPGPEPWEYAWEREMDAQLAGLREHLCRGGAADYPEYRQICGEIRGIQNTMDELKRIRHRLENPDDDADLRGGL